MNWNWSVRTRVLAVVDAVALPRIGPHGAGPRRLMEWLEQRAAFSLPSASRDS